MSRALWISATGMMGQELNIDVISNNLANVNTPGFKKSRIEFKDLMYQNVEFAGGNSTESAKKPTGLQVGLGTYPVATQKEFGQGDLLNTKNPLDLTIVGDGFFQITQADGTIGYTRDGSFKRDADGRLVTSEGFAVEPQITIPKDATDIQIGIDGTISVMVPGSTTPSQVGQLQIARFANPSGLESRGNNLLVSTTSSGDPVIGTPSSEGRGTIQQGFLELSNVEIAEEMIRMIVAQRAYEINSKAIQAEDTLMSIANNLRH